MAPKKRFKMDALKDIINHSDPVVHEEKKSPFRPWDDTKKSNDASQSSNSLPNLHPGLLAYHPYLLWLQHPALSIGQVPVVQEPEQKEPLALVKTTPTESIEPVIPKIEPLEQNDEKNDFIKESLDKNEKKAKQRNYKNMTRERRVEANARERQRVQTITEQFETLRNVIPVDDKNSKMSKLSIIKIATSYIMYLSRQCGYDYTTDKSEPSIEECYHNLKNLINYESKMNGTNAGGASTSTCPQDQASGSDSP